MPDIKWLYDSGAITYPSVPDVPLILMKGSFLYSRRQRSAKTNYRSDTFSHQVAPHSAIQNYWVQSRDLCRTKLLPVTCFGGHMGVNC